jgi:hypothetical protein
MNPGKNKNSVMENQCSMTLLSVVTETDVV